MKPPNSHSIRPAKGNRRAVFQIATDDLDANRQPIVCMAVQPGIYGQTGQDRNPGPSELIVVGDLRAVHEVDR